jgi:hypothetical protein
MPADRDRGQRRGETPATRQRATRARAKAAANSRKTAPDWREPFLEAFRATGLVTDACRAAGISRATAYRRRQSDEAFALDWRDAELDVLALLEDEAVRRALHGVERPVSIGGERELVRTYSDSLLALLLRSRAPERYVDRHQLEHAGRVEHEHVYDPDAVELSAELRARVRRILGEDDDR